MNVLKSSILILFVIPSVILFSCSKNEGGTNATADEGQVAFEITDAPIDNANVSGAFVTVSEIRVDGETWSGFSGKKTIDILAYQNGNTEALGTGKLDVGSYSKIELVLDYAADENGNTPGCYIMTADNTKTNLNSTAASTGTISINQSDFEVASNSSATFVIDFDLRKAIEKGEGAKDYSFKSASSLNAALRAESKATAGTIKGKVSGSATASMDDVVVFAYKKGTYSSTEASSDSNTQFQGAITSAKADNNGNYTLSFLEEGDYELIFCNYDDSDNDGEVELKGRLTLDIAGSLDLQSVNVSSSTTATLDITALAIISF